MEYKWLQLGLLAFLAIFFGLAFGVLPAASTILTGVGGYQLSLYLYSLLFIPLTLSAVFGLFFVRRITVKDSLAIGLFFTSAAMLLLGLTYIGANKFPLNICLLVVVALGIGIGAGTFLPSLLSLADHSIKSKPFSSLVLMGMVAFGMGLAPLLVNYFQPLDLWWIVPITIFVGLLLLFNFTIFIPMLSFPARQEEDRSFHYPWTFWLFAAVVLLYGFCESALSNWSSLYVDNTKGLSFINGNKVLATFWIMVMLGRLLIGAATVWVSFRWFYMLIPLFLFWSLNIIPAVELPRDLMIAFGLAGLACSAFLLLSLYFGKETHAEENVTGLLCAYLLGYGLGGYVPGELQHLHKIPLEALYPFAGLPAALLTILSWCLLYFFPHRPKKEESSGLP